MATRQQRRAEARAEAKRTKVYIGAGHREPARTCPACRRRLDAAFSTSIDGAVAERMGPGDLTVCAYCSAMLVIQDDDTLRPATQAEFDSLPPSLRLLATHVGHARTHRL